MKPAATIAVVAGLVALAAVAGTAAWRVMTPAAVVETPAPAVQQGDGSVVLERAPDAKAKPKHKTPKRTKVERVIGVDVQPSGEGLKPVHVDLSLVREDSGARRVVASSPDGAVVSGIDIPVEPVPVPKRWAAGLSWSPTDKTAGVWAERDIGRLRLGVELMQSRPALGAGMGIEARLRVGLTF